MDIVANRINDLIFAAKHKSRDLATAPERAPIAQCQQRDQIYRRVRCGGKKSRWPDGNTVFLSTPSLSLRRRMCFRYLRYRYAYPREFLKTCVQTSPATTRDKDAPIRFDGLEGRAIRCSTNERERFVQPNLSFTARTLLCKLMSF